MTSRQFVLCSARCTTAALFAGPTDDALATAMKLSAATNYTWTTRIEQNGRTAEISGQTGGGAYSLLKFTGFSGPRAQAAPPPTRCFSATTNT